MSDPPRVYVVKTGQSRFTDDCFGVLMTESGEILGGHMSSSMWWLTKDLTERPNRVAILAARYPDGFEVVQCEGPGYLPADVLAAHRASNPAIGSLGRLP